ncbi:MAG: hypothetical protein MK074_07010 [Phycisphaerales bacterium]|nr:hypothetical protein [Phycisphaerales bacterium]
MVELLLLSASLSVIIHVPGDAPTPQAGVDLACSQAGGSWHEDMACGGGVCPDVCVEDINNDRRVNMTDVLLVIEAWGMCL